MANLLYKGHKKCCYNGINSGTQTITGYAYDSSSTYMASYYADLQPNTTYTLSKIDTSSRFRVATYTEDVKLKNENNQTALSQWWFADDQSQITFTTGANDIYLVVYYTNNSEYNTRIMLNEGDTAEPYEAPTRVIPHQGIWTVSDGRLVHDDLPEPLESVMSEPYPPFWWSVSGGKLTHPGLPAPVMRGAFAHCKNLDTAHIPESCKQLGTHTFRGTALQSVKIASDCVYSTTTFPEECEIEFYEDSEVENNE